MEPKLTEYDDLLANVRYDNRFHSIRNLVQPYDPEVVKVAALMHQTGDFIRACHEFVHAFTTYEMEVGDYWRTPAESLALRRIDCDDSAILLCSLLRRYLPADQVFCAAGIWINPKERGGHMWVRVNLPGEEPQILESTGAHNMSAYGTYEISILFNDEYAFATPRGLKEFGLIPTEDVIKSLVVAGAIPPGI
jgi:hypothetical protein